MKKGSIRIFTEVTYSKPLHKNYITNKPIIKLFDDIWSMDIIDLNDYTPENKRGFLCILVVINKFSKIDWTFALNNKNAQSVNNSLKKFSNHLKENQIW